MPGDRQRATPERQDADVDFDFNRDLNIFRSGIWCAWQESNLLPLAPQASALSGELQARALHVSRALTAAAPAWNDAVSRLVNTTTATKTFFRQIAICTGAFM